MSAQRLAIAFGLVYALFTSAPSESIAGPTARARTAERLPPTPVTTSTQNDGIATPKYRANSAKNSGCIRIAKGHWDCYGPPMATAEQDALLKAVMFPGMTYTPRSPITRPTLPTAADSALERHPTAADVLAIAEGRFGKEAAQKASSPASAASHPSLDR